MEEENRTIKLQRCPNCGCSAFLHKTKRNSFWRYKYECGECWTQTKLHYSEKDAAKEWNKLKRAEKDNGEN